MGVPAPFAFPQISDVQQGRSGQFFSAGEELFFRGKSRLLPAAGPGENGLFRSVLRRGSFPLRQAGERRGKTAQGRRKERRDNFRRGGISGDFIYYFMTSVCYNT